MFYLFLILSFKNSSENLLNYSDALTGEFLLMAPLAFESFILFIVREMRVEKI